MEEERGLAFVVKTIVYCSVMLGLYLNFLSAPVVTVAFAAWLIGFLAGG